MLIERLPDGSPTFCVGWREFLADWQGADQAHRVVLTDGRPAVRSEPGEGEERSSYTTLHPHVWPMIRRRLKEAFARVPAAKRVRLCEACRAEMKVAQEHGAVWVFRCPACGSVEIHGKDRIGGTMGAGEKERP